MAKTIFSKTADFNYRDVSLLLRQGRNPYWCRLNGRLIEQLLARYKHWPAPPPALELEQGRSSKGRVAEHTVAFLLFEIDQTQDALAQLKTRHEDYLKHSNRAPGLEQKRQEMLDYARRLGADERQLRLDKQAFERWFDHDALLDRYNKRYWQQERYLCFALDCLGRVAATGLSADGDALGYQKLWARFALERAIRPLLNYDGDKRVVTNSFHALTEALKALPRALQRNSLSDTSIRFIYHACLRNSPFTWVQCEALKLLQSAAPGDLYVVIKTRLEHPTGDADLFVRRVLVQILCEQLSDDAHMAELLLPALRDPSAAVRQKLAEALAQTDTAVIEHYYPPLLFDDAVPQVRASAIHQLGGLITRASGFGLATDLLARSLAGETDVFCLRVGLLCCKQGFVDLAQSGDSERIQRFLSRLLPVVEGLHQTAPALSVRRWAAQTREYLLCHNSAAVHAQIEALRQFVSEIPPGKTRRLPAHLAMADKKLGRLLAVIAQDDFGFDIEHNRFGRFVTRGHVFGFRVWRLLHELSHPSSDKRQAFSHTRGRLFYGRHRVPSALLSELAETKVPGEPLHMESEGGWRPYLPLVDEVLSALSLGNRASYFYHSEGITQLQPPVNFVRRWRASWLLSRHFTDYAHWRNWQENSQLAPDLYLKKLAELGITVTFRRHDCEFGEVSADPAVLRFFPAAMPLIDGQTWEQFQQYFVSVYENTLSELAVFMAVALAIFVGRHVYLYRQIRRARKRIPLVMGGWGTRGKSGTERIKAALINALGHGVVSKTTGCEAMFLHAQPFGPLRELSLFRPYDKATIWEQHNVVCMTDKLDSEVLLWECMGLNPAYIKILQQQWMSDDIATLTNTYPDHEDIQGPAGINIPEVMAEFIPKRATLLTSEEQMQPILKAASKDRHTRFKSVGWLEAGLLPPDMLTRFPYDEHPFNIALVLALADELGVDGDFALKEMADRVVPDLGVLKTFPRAPMRSRQLEFINGMSANERYGCLSNWVRVGLDKHTLDRDPDTWITIVINNRADRVARSRVFASILVKDVSFDRCVLIGNNLNGLQAYIRESWLEWVADINLPADSQSACATIEQMAKRLRIPYTEQLVATRCRLMIRGQHAEVSDELIESWLTDAAQLERQLVELDIAHHQQILAFWQRDRQLLAGYQRFLTAVANAGRMSMELQQQFQELLWQWFEEKLLVVEDYHAGGQQIIETVCLATPPGFYNRIMGMQNIKGTGLDFVYRWLAWDVCYKACQQLLSLSAAELRQGLQTLATFQAFGFLEEETVRQTIASVREHSVAQTELNQAQMDLILDNLNQALKRLRQQESAEKSGGQWLASVITAVQAFMDVGDAVKRRKEADRIYQDLIDERISYDSAILALQTLNKRQKGG